jgi:hypothetical protein
MRPTAVGVQKAIDMPCRARKAIKSFPIHTNEQPSVKAESSAYPVRKIGRFSTTSATVPISSNEQPIDSA